MNVFTGTYTNPTLTPKQSPNKNRVLIRLGDTERESSEGLISMTECLESTVLKVWKEIKLLERTDCLSNSTKFFGKMWVSF